MAPKIRDYYACDVHPEFGCACAMFRINKEYMGRLTEWEEVDMSQCSNGRYFPRDQWTQFSVDLEQWRSFLLDSECR